MDTTLSVSEQIDQLMETVKNAAPGEDALRYLHQLRLNYDSAIKGYLNSLKVLGDTTYEDRKHFLLELIQNADDAKYEGKPAISFHIYQDYFEIEYNELGFQTEDVIAITDTGASTKTASKFAANSFIGEKGIGFKSVFALAREVHIHSGPWHFKLNKNNYIVPEILANTHETEGTKLRIYFSNTDSIELVSLELNKLLTERLESFLFLQRLNIFSLTDHRKELPVKHILDIEKYGSRSLVLSATPVGIERAYALFEGEIEFEGKLVGMRWERMGSQHSLKRQLKVAVMLDPALNSAEFGRLFCYLPTEVKLPVPLFLQVDGHLKADRERLHDIQNNEWNKYLLSELPQFLCNAILSWRNHEQISKWLPDLLPKDPGQDQLSAVFEKMMVNLTRQPWVKTYSGWCSPFEVVVAPTFWYDWFEEFPDLRIEVELTIGKRFVHPEWARTSRWNEKWGVYNVSKLEPLEVVEILCEVILPENFLKSNKHITRLFEYIKSLAEERNMRSHFLRRLVNASIFPLDGDVFGTLLGDNGKEIQSYWMSGRTKRSTGLPPNQELKILDVEYTYSPNLTDENTERQMELKIIALRNEAIRNVLKYLYIPELNDDRLLMDLQIPYLLKEEPMWTRELLESKYDVFYSVFEVYLAKRSSPDESYLKQLARLREMYVQNENGKMVQLYKIILPSALRLREGDNLYESVGLSSIKLLEKWFIPEIKIDQSGEGLQSYLKQLRDFLVYCGIANGPQFLYEEQRFQSASHLREENKVLFDRWLEKNNTDYTSGNNIKVQNVLLDQATRQLLTIDNVTIQIEIRLYQEWLKQYQHRLDNEMSNHYRFLPPPGYVRTSYTRREIRHLIIPTDLWAGVSYHDVPIQTVDGRLSKVNQIVKVASSRGLDKALQFFDIVVEGQEKGYHPFYLSSLGVPSLTVNVINKAWKQCNKDKLDGLMKATYELSNNQIDLNELMIFDKNSDILKPIHYFKLGKSVNENTAYIEEQYGSFGKLLGEKLGLQTDSEIVPMLSDLERFYKKILTSEEKSEKFNKVLLNWDRLSKEDQRKLTIQLDAIQKKYNATQDTVVIFNQESLYKLLVIKNPFIVHISCDPITEATLEGAVRSLNFKLLEEIGTLKVEGAAPLTSEEEKILQFMFTMQLEELEINEKAKLLKILARFGGGEIFTRNLLHASGLIKQLYELGIPAALPFYDENKNVFYVRQGEPLTMLAARFVSFFGLTTFKSAMRDFEAFQKTYNKMQVDTTVTSSSSLEIKLLSSEEQEKKSIYNDELDDSEHKAETLKAKIYENQQDKLNKNQVEQNTDIAIFPTSNSKSIIENNSKVKTELVTSGVAIEDDTVQELIGEKSSISSIQIELQESMKRERENNKEAIDEEWHTGPDKDDSIQSYERMLANLEETLENKPVIQQITPSETKKMKTKMGPVTVVEPKEYLLAQYRGRCQVCATQLALPNGQFYFEVFRIREEQEQINWANEPFNTLCLCPNCHALAKHGATVDLTGILEEAKLLLQQETFPIEVELFKGDLYVVQIILNGQVTEMFLTEGHLNYFALFMRDGVDDLKLNV